MGLVYAEVELINSEDITLVKHHIIGREEIKRMNLNLLVDTGSYMLCLNESIQEQLQFPIVEKRKAQLSNGHLVECDVVSSMEVKFKNRRTFCNAMILQGDIAPLPGVIPLEDMDVIIDPQKQILEVNPEHPYFAQMKIK